MDLKNNKIKMSVLLADSRAKKILMQEFPQFFSPILLSFAKRMTLDEVLNQAKGRVPKDKIKKVLDQLRQL